MLDLLYHGTVYLKVCIKGQLRVHDGATKHSCDCLNRSAITSTGNQKSALMIEKEMKGRKNKKGHV